MDIHVCVNSTLFFSQVSTFELAPSVMYYRNDNGSLLFRYGEDIAVTETIAHILNFTLKFAEPADGNEVKHTIQRFSAISFFFYIIYLCTVRYKKLVFTSITTRTLQ